tara:strand:+ start:11049 stop:11279 length:231 start_codon:yes stop_codon:yes gene_type:complete
MAKTQLQKEQAGVWRDEAVRNRRYNEARSHAKYLKSHMRHQYDTGDAEAEDIIKEINILASKLNDRIKIIEDKHEG